MYFITDCGSKYDALLSIVLVYYLFQSLKVRTVKRVFIYFLIFRTKTEYIKTIITRDLSRANTNYTRTRVLRVRGS